MRATAKSKRMLGLLLLAATVSLVVASQFLSTSKKSMRGGYGPTPPLAQAVAIEDVVFEGDGDSVVIAPRNVGGLRAVISYIYLEDKSYDIAAATERLKITYFDGAGQLSEHLDPGFSAKIVINEPSLWRPNQAYHIKVETSGGSSAAMQASTPEINQGRLADDRPICSDLLTC